MAMTAQHMQSRALKISDPIHLAGETEPTYVRELRRSERNVLDEKRLTKNPDGSRALNMDVDDVCWVVACQCDEQGKLLWTWEQLPTVIDLGAVTLSQIAEAAVKLNALGASAVEAEAKKS